MQSAAKKKLPGQFLFEDFVTEKEERELVAFIDSCEPPWHLSTFNGPHKCADLTAMATCLAKAVMTKTLIESRAL